MITFLNSQINFNYAVQTKMSVQCWDSCDGDLCDSFFKAYGNMID